MANPDQLPTIDLAALSQVSGGASTRASSSDGDEVLTALSGILDSIHSLANQRANGGGFNQQEMLLLMMMMQQRNQQVAPVQAWPWSQEPIIRYY